MPKIQNHRFTFTYIPQTHLLKPSPHPSKQPDSKNVKQVNLNRKKKTYLE